METDATVAIVLKAEGEDTRRSLAEVLAAAFGEQGVNAVLEEAQPNTNMPAILLCKAKIKVLDMEGDPLCYLKATNETYRR